MRKKKERYLEVLTEEPSVEAFLRTLLTSLLPEGPTFSIHGYFRGGLGKVEAARAIAVYIDPSRNRSTSFARFRDAVIETTT
jgi:hypothetical protein